jgi:non-ribosomal peptide synthetase component F
MFVVQSSVEQPAALVGLSEERVVAERGTAKFDLSLFVGEVTDGLRVAVEYCSDLFEEETAVRLLEQFGVLLEQALAEPSRPVSELRLLGEAEERLVSEEFNQTAVEREWRPLRESVAAQATRTPDGAAVSWPGGSLSYRQLEAAANRLAHRLADAGVGPGQIVAVAGERSPQLAVAVLAAVNAGAAYAPIDPAYPPDRIEFMLAETQAPVLVTSRELLDRLPSRQAEVLLLEEIDLADDHDPGPPPIDGSLTDLAYVLYTSGSTGRPKGVAMPQRPLVNLLDWQLEQWRTAGLDPARTLQFASLSFDVAFQDLVTPWASGGTLVLVDDDLRRDP